MAVTVAVVQDFPNYRQSSVIMTADADVAAVIPHGMGVATVIPSFEVGGRVAASAAAARLSGFTQGVVDATNVNVGATNAGSSGTAGVQLLVDIFRPTSFMR